MQTLDVISVNIWQILISLVNLLILFLILKRFLYKPVKNVLKKRQEEIDEQYRAAEEAEKSALADKEAWENKIKNAETEAETIILKATDKASHRSDKILNEAKAKADEIVIQAKNDAELELKKAEDGIKQEIISVSTTLTEKMLEREINDNDHRALIDSFIESIGDNDDVDE